MPTVLRLDGFQVIVYPNDHRPAHVHVKNAEHEAIFELNCPAGPATLRENYGFSERIVNTLLKMLASHVPALCEGWRSIHGDA